MIGYHTAEQIRTAEAATGLLDDGVLMRRAATGLANVVATELNKRCGAIYGRRVGIIVGHGDNGGDALWAGAFLARRGVCVQAVAVDRNRVHTTGSAAFAAAGGRFTEQISSDTDVVIDGVVGLRGSGPLRSGPARLFADVVAPIIAVDLPTGVDADTGVVNVPSVKPSVTVTFSARRRAHILAAHHCGRVECVDIGINPQPADLVEFTDAEVGALWPVPGPTDDKYSQGVVGIVAGSRQYPGAAVLCSAAAVAATSGMVRYVGTAAAQVVSDRPEVVAVDQIVDAGRVQAWVLGPGMGTDSDAADVVCEILRTDIPVLIDADALTIVARHPDWVRERKAVTLLTPHSGEFARLASGPVQADRARAARHLASSLQCTVLLKGNTTVIADPSGPVIANSAGNAWAATAGAGDVLSGIAGSLLAAGLGAQVAGAVAARAHARAAAIAANSHGDCGVPIRAHQITDSISAAVSELRAQVSR